MTDDPQKLASVAIGQSLHKDYPSSEIFTEQMGRYMGDPDFFLPSKNVLPPGTRIEIKFTLANGFRDILAGAARVTGLHSGGGVLPMGMHLEWIEMTDRSRRNLAMILEWKKNTGLA